MNEVLVEESLIGWKELELEVMRDKHDNAIIVCSIENIDAMGVHTGDSITIAPIQTLSDSQYQRMRTAAIDILRAVGVDCGGSNVQFAMEPDSDRMIVIEMNPRGVPLFRAGKQGDGVSHRPVFCETRGGIHFGRSAQRNHRKDGFLF